MIFPKSWLLGLFVPALTAQQTVMLTTVIEYDSDFIPFQFNTGMALADQQAEKDKIYNQIKNELNEIMLNSFSLPADQFVISNNYKYREHANPWRYDYANKAEVSFHVNHLVSTGDFSDQAKTKAAYEKIRQALSLTASNFRLIPSATATSVTLFNPCNSPFYNDCDKNAHCTGTLHNLFESARSKEAGWFHDPAAYFTCKCKDGFINHRTYDPEINMFVLEGSVCIENKYKDTRTWEHAMIGLIFMCCFCLVMIIVLIAFCIGSRKRRMNWMKMYNAKFN